jgi:hypothetical protein
MPTTIKHLENILADALLNDGDMAHSLYEHELEEHLDNWKKGMKKDKNDFLFVVTVNNGHFAMILITKQGNVLVNELARLQLRVYWSNSNVYETNINYLMPQMAKQLANNEFPVFGINTVDRMK